jgi:acyl-CoA reductase-like NAD-dependent aldehyde dehydrogenase
MLAEISHHFPFLIKFIIFYFRSNNLPEMGCINFTVRNPVGVAALISPWNLPLCLLQWSLKLSQ